MKIRNKGLSLVAAILLALAMAVTPSLAKADDEAVEAPSSVAVQAVAGESDDEAEEAEDEVVDETADHADAAEEAVEETADSDTTEAAAQAAAEVEKAEEAAQAAPDETAAATEGDTTATDADAATGGEGETIYPLPSVTTSFDGPGRGSVTFVFQNPNENQQWFSAWLTPGAGVEVDCATIDLSHQGSVCSTSVLRTAITVPGQSSGTLVVPLDLTGFGPWGIDVLTFDPWGETGVEGGLAIRSAPDQASSFVVVAEVKDGQIVARFDLSQEYADAAYFNWVVNPQQGVTWVDCTAATHVYACGAGASGDVWVASGQPATVTLVADAAAGPITVTGWVQRPGLSTQEAWTFTVQVPAPPTTPSSPTTPPTSAPSEPPATSESPTPPPTTAPTTPSSPTTPPTSAPSAPATSDGAKSARSAGHARQHQDNVVEGAAATAPSTTASTGPDGSSTQLALPQTGGPGTGPGSAPAPGLLALAVTAAAAAACGADALFSLTRKRLR